MSKKALHSLHFLPYFSTTFHQYYCYLREIWRKRSPSNTEHNHDIHHCAICNFGMTIVAQIWRAIISALAHNLTRETTVSAQVSIFYSVVYRIHER